LLCGVYIIPFCGFDSLYGAFNLLGGIYIIPLPAFDSPSIALDFSTEYTEFLRWFSIDASVRIGVLWLFSRESSLGTIKALFIKETDSDAN